MKFTKMNTLGNDFIIINETVKDPQQLAKDLCRRKFAIGGNGLIIIEKSQKVDFKVSNFNPDGTESELSINGSRCAAKYAFDKKIVKNKIMTIETKKRRIKAQINENNITINAGEPILTRKEIPMLGEGTEVINEQLVLKDRIVRITALSLDNPHCVIFTDNLEEYAFEEEGKLIEKNEQFPKRTNVEFIQIDNENEITMKVWERGVGTTLSCGTGACAACVAGVLNEKTKRDITVHTQGGDVEVEWEEKTNNIKITGPVEYNFSGEIKR